MQSEEVHDGKTILEGEEQSLAKNGSVIIVVITCKNFG